jgi:hypothetical protein
VRSMNGAIFFAVCSVICTAALVASAFASALLGYRCPKTYLRMGHFRGGGSTKFGTGTPCHPRP